MRYIVFTLITLMCSLGSFAQSSKVKQGTVDKLSESIRLNAIDPLENEIQSLRNQILSIKSQVDRIKNRKFKKSGSSITTDELVQRLSIYPTISSLLDDEYDKDGYVTKLLDDAEESQISSTYRLIIDINNSLNEVYNEKNNTALLDRIAKSQEPLQKHVDSYNTLVEYVKYYRFYMYELGRLLDSAKGKDLKGSSERKALKLTELEEAEDLIDIPFTYYILKKYFDGNLTKEDKDMLYHACPGAFPDYKP